MNIDRVRPAVSIAIMVGGGMIITLTSVTAMPSTPIRIVAVAVAVGLLLPGIEVVIAARTQNRLSRDNALMANELTTLRSENAAMRTQMT